MAGYRGYFWAKARTCISQTLPALPTTLLMLIPIEPIPVSMAVAVLLAAGAILLFALANLLAALAMLLAAVTMLLAAMVITLLAAVAMLLVVLVAVNERDIAVALVEVVSVVAVVSIDNPDIVPMSAPDISMFSLRL